MPIMANLPYTLALIGGFVLLALVIRAVQTRLAVRPARRPPTR